MHDWESEYTNVKYLQAMFSEKNWLEETALESFKYLRNSELHRKIPIIYVSCQFLYCIYFKCFIYLRVEEGFQPVFTVLYYVWCKKKMYILLF